LRISRPSISDKIALVLFLKTKLLFTVSISQIFAKAEVQRADASGREHPPIRLGEEP